VFDNGQSNIVPVSARERPGRHRGEPLFREKGGFLPLSAVGTAHAPLSGTGTHPSSGRQEMDKFEAFAFAFGFVATGVLTLIASVPLA
jgi:hypothetical protein